MKHTPDLLNDTALIHFEDRQKAIPLALSVAQSAKRQICIMGRDIDRPLFDTVEFVECIRQLALSSPRAQIKILAQKTKGNVKSGHRIIPLSQQLSSLIHVRTPDIQHSNIQNILILADDFAYLKCPKANYYQGTACFYDRLEVRHLQSKFDDIWSHATVDMSIRRLHL
jgi:hypothetical protein